MGETNRNDRVSQSGTANSRAKTLVIKQDTKTSVGHVVAFERLIIAVIVASIAAALVVGFHDLRHDDAFITFRYAQNLSRGRGLVFNPGGVRIMGATSPGLILAAAAMHAFVGDAALPSVMSGLGCLAWSLSALAVYVFLRGSLPWFIPLFASLSLVAGVTGAESWVSLETHWAIALTLWSIVVAIRGRFFSSAILAALAAWMRPDALLAVVPLAIYVAAKLRWRVLWPLALGVLCVVPWYVFAGLYFGDVLPQSFRVKASIEPFWDYAMHVYGFVGQTLLPWASPWATWLGVLVGYGLLIFRAPNVGLLAGYGALHLASYLVLRSGKSYVWHLQPLVVVAAVGLFGGAACLLALPHRAIRYALSFALVACLAMSARQVVLHARSHQEELWLGARDAVYRDVAQYLRERSSPTDLVSTEEVGTIAYYSDLRMNDRTGLVSRTPMAAIHRYVRGEQTNLRWLILRRPELEPAQPVYQRRVPIVFRKGPFGVFLFDLREPAPQ